MFLYLQETWLPYHEVQDISKDFSDYEFLATSSDMFIPTEDLILRSGPSWHGTAIGWKKSISNNITKFPTISDRFCGVKFEDPSLQSTIITYCAYLPTTGQDDDFLEVLALLRHDIAQNNIENSTVIIGTDSNVSIKSTNRRKVAMEQFVNEFSFKAILQNDEPTFHHNNQTSESQIDQIFFHIPEKSDIEIRLQDHLCLKDNSENLSSHDVIIGRIFLPSSRVESLSTDYSCSYSDFIVKKPKWNRAGMEGYQKDTEILLQNLSEKYDEVEYIPALCEMFSKALVLSAEKNFEITNPTFNKKKSQFPQFSQAYKAAHFEHQQVFKRWREAGRPTDTSHPCKQAVLISRRNLQRIRRNEEAIKSINLHDDLMNTFDTDRNKIYSKLKNSRGENTRINNIPFIETLAGRFEGTNVLEGFAQNTEILCNEAENETFDNKFYKTFIEDNMVIMEITENENVEIPHINLVQLKNIIFKKLKVNKACDVFKLTVEHLRNAGDSSLVLIMQLLNAIIDNINVLASPQLNTSIASVVHKGKGKSVFHHKSYRLVRITPLFSRLIDEYMRPELVKIVRPVQNSNQYGFTESISYLLGAVQRHEVEKFCIDMKKTFFGCSLDGDSAFEVVNRAIQTRELYCAGERGQFWQASQFSYQNSLTRIKMNGKLSRNIKEKLGVKQGRNKSSDHYKIYIAPLLDTLEHSELGVWIGHINVAASGVADDVYLMTDKQNKLQELINIAVHYGKMYRITYGASKTKVTVVGSDIDARYFKDVKPWQMDGQVVQVVEDNEHLGQLVSNTNQAQKNVDLKLNKGRKNLFSLLGAGFAFKCHLSPILKLHIYRTYTCPITRSGLAAFALRSAQIEPLALFQRKTLKSILKLSNGAPTPAIHFLTGELPVEGKVHKDIFALFYSIWSNPDTKIHEIVKYLLKHSDENSRTWSVHVRHLSKLYGLEDPLICLQRDPPSRSQYKELIATKITAYFEKMLRAAAARNSLMCYLNVAALGLRGRHHPALAKLITTHDVRISKPHLKFLSGNYLTYSTRATQSGGSPACRLCTSGSEETVCHVISTCLALAQVRNKVFCDFRTLCKQTTNNLDFDAFLENEELTCQFILDPTSLNLPIRVSQNEPLLNNFFNLSRDFCYLIDKTRISLLKEAETS